MKILPQNTVVFYKGIPHKILGYARKNNDSPLRVQILSLWRESEQDIFIQGEQGVKRTVDLDEIEEAPEGVSINKEDYLSVVKNNSLLELLTKESGLKVEGEMKARYSLVLSLGSLWVEGEKNLLHTLINSASSSGKGHVTKAVFDLLPKQLGVYRTRISPTVLTYWHANNEDWSWDGKLLFLDDVSENVLNSEVLKVMLTEGSTATITKDGEAIDLHIPGKPVVWLTTAHSETNEEATNRLLFLGLTETEDQTKAIMKRQADEAAGLREIRDYDFMLRQSLSLLERVKVIIPYAPSLPQHFPSSQVSMRRDFPRFIGLIKSSAALHQYRREKDDQGRVIASWADYDAARMSFTNYAFDSHGVKLSGKMKKAAEYVLDLLNRVVHSTVDGESFITIKDAQNCTVYNGSSWYNILHKLTELKILRKSSIDGEGIKPVSIYLKARDVEELTLPSSEEIREIG